MHWIAKPFILPLQMFGNTKMNTLFQTTRTKLAASEGTWRLPSSPIVENNLCFPYVNSNSREKCIESIFHDCFQHSREKCIGSPNPLFYRCKFSNSLHLYEKIQKTAARIAASEADWRLQPSPIVRKKHVHFPM